MRDPWQEAMLDGDFERAWTISDAVMRQRARQSCAELPYHLRWVWDGAAFCGRNVLVRCYHGLGDTLQFIRFVPKLAAMAASVMVEAQPALLPLLSSVPRYFGALSARRGYPDIRSGDRVRWNCRTLCGSASTICRGQSRIWRRRGLPPRLAVTTRSSAKTAARRDRLGGRRLAP